MTLPSTTFKIEKRFQGDKALLNWGIWGVVIAWACFQVWTAWIPLPAFYQRSIHLLFGYFLVFMTIDYKGHEKLGIFRWEGFVLALVSSACLIYALLGWSTKASTRGMELPMDEMVMGLIFIAVTMEVCRRAVGWTIPIIAIILIIYGRFGELLPEVLAHRNYTLERMVTSFYISLEGIMGYLAHISTTFIFMFVIFGAFLRTSGAGDWFIKLSYALFGHVRGGPAKIAVVASTMFGMVSGSAVANVAGTGQFTIPLMKRYGYPGHFAGGVEATASAGGQIMPPIMGGAAFIMCEILGIAYIEVIKSVIIIACLFYLSIFIMIDIEAQKRGLKGVPKEELPPVWETFKEGWFYLIPPLLLLYLMAVVRYSPTLCGLYATLSILICSWFRKESRMGIKKTLIALEDTCYTFRPIAAVLGCAGLLVGLVNMTGLGLMLSGLLVELSQGILPLLLFLTMISSIILGMGVPITASYVILSILVAPALTEIGVLPIAAHLFIFYFGVFSAITPPFAPDAFVAGGIAGASPMKTAFTACKVGLIGIILPYIMIYDHALLMIGSSAQIIMAILTAILGIIALGSAINGFLFRRINIFSRLLLIGSALVMITPGRITDVIGAGIFIAVCFIYNPNFFVDLYQKYIINYIPALRR